MIYLLLGWCYKDEVPRGYSTHTDFTFAINQFRMMADSNQYENATFNKIDLTKPKEPKIECLGSWKRPL